MKKRVLAAAMSMMMAASIFGGSVPARAAESDQEVVDLRLIFYGDASSRRDEFFKNEFHDAVLNDLNIDLTVEFLPWGSDTNVSTMLASGENFAIEYIVSNYDWHTKGYLATIDLAYGSSITHGSLALAAPYSYCFRVAQMMNCDYINLGFAGSAQMEEGMAEYIMSRKDWDFASFEMGINMIDLPEKLFEENVCRFTEAFTKEERPIFFTDIYGSNEQEPNQTTIIRYREIARQQFLKHLSQKKNAVYVSGLELLNNPSFLSQDLTHPSLEGIDEIAKNWFHVMSRF